MCVWVYSAVVLATFWMNEEEAVIFVEFKKVMTPSKKKFKSPIELCGMSFIVAWFVIVRVA